jgi:putative heme-binding domain-containing protein
VTELQGASGVPVRWQAAGPLSADAALPLIERFAPVPATPEAAPATAVKWQTLIGAGTEARIRLGPAPGGGPGRVWLAYADVLLPEQAAVQFLTSASGALRVWLNGRLAYRRDEPRPFQPESDRFDAALARGVNRLLVQVAPAQGDAEFHLRFRRKSAAADRERLTQAALTRSGNAERGRQVFFDAARSQCVKCHRLGEQGERIGPDLTGIGNRFARVYLVESILEPSRTIAPGYEAVTVLLADGRVVTGTRVAETADALTLGDNQGQKHVLAKSRIEQSSVQPASLMPDGLEKQLTADDFVDLIAFLVSQR